MGANLIYHLDGVDKQENTYRVDEVKPMTLIFASTKAPGAKLCLSASRPSLEGKPVISIQSRFDTNSSSETAQKLRSLQV